MRMLKILAAAVLFVLPLSVFADDAGQQLTQMLNNLTNLQAKFAQTVADKSGTNLQQTSGKMALQRPGKFRWETQSPSKQLLIADGKKVWFYDVDLSQVTVQDQQNTNKNSPAMLLSGDTESLAQDFIISSVPSSNATLEIFKLVPKEGNSLFQAVQLTFQNKLLHGMRLTDNLGQTTTVRFSQAQNNSVLSPRLFQFTPPKGVTVVKN